MPEPDRSQQNQNRLVEYYGVSFALVFRYAGSSADSGVETIEYCSRVLFDGRTEQASQQRVQYNPNQCRDIFDWTESEQAIAKKSKDVARYQSVLEIADSVAARGLRAGAQAGGRVPGEIPVEPTLFSQPANRSPPSELRKQALRRSILTAAFGRLRHP